MRRRALAAVAIAALAWLGWHVAGFVVAQLDSRALLVHENTLRDFEVYGRYREGLLPLQGPITSVGGNHGWIAAHLFGLAVTLWPSLDALYAATLLMVVAGALASALLAWRLAPGWPALLGATITLATHVWLLVTFPSHIALILLATPLAFLGATVPHRPRTGAALTGVGIALAMGAHRNGWVLLAAFAAVAVLGRVRVLRHPIAWIPIALYLLPELVVATLGGSPTPTDAGAVQRWIERMEPWNVLRKMPFMQLPDRPFDALQASQLVFALLTLALARPGLHTPPARFLGGFYVLSSLALLGLPFDPQYYMPALSLLPALVAVAARETERRGLGIPWTAATLAVVLPAGWDVTHLDPSSPSAEGLRPLHVGEDEAAVAWLGRQRVTEAELFGRTIVPTDRPLGYLAAALLDLSGPQPSAPRCFRLARKAEVTDAAGWEPIGETLAGRVDPDGPCPGNIVRYDSPVWYVDVPGRRFVRR